MAERALRASSYAKDPTPVTATLTEYDRAARIRRAAKIGLLLVLVAILLAPIPVVHLVGLAVGITGVVLGVRRLREEATLVALKGACPACRDEQNFPAEGRLSLPVTLRCPGCSEFVKIEAG